MCLSSLEYDPLFVVSTGHILRLDIINNDRLYKFQEDLVHNFGHDNYDCL
jgi:hypothetical protein